ncbi:MAG TPA: nucleoside phosphorylase [Saprospiraceae bacterium]|nr:nucleoside phosphorylase [Saprospiraceae bacterium]HMQ85338.1 nucleoside phosphorylase [Saprospiraceae bacterium]
MLPIQHSELVLNADGSVYHLHLHPEDIADTILTVGDPDRVAQVSKYFDSIDIKKNKREFITHTGELNGKRLTVISTGIGPDNIDIVLNELDALVNVDLASRQVKEQLTSLQLIRIGTSGSLQADLEVGSFLASSYALGLDNLMAFYEPKQNLAEASLHDALHQFWDQQPAVDYYVAQGSKALLEKVGHAMAQGITATCPGFYAPQGRSIRLRSRFNNDFFQHMGHFQYEGQRITNLEMETSALYGLSRLLGHHALSASVLLANRVTKQFSDRPKKHIEQLIEHVLERLTSR